MRQLQAGHRRIVGFDDPVLGQVGDRRFAQRHATLQTQNIHPFFTVQQEVNQFRRRLRVFRRFANGQHLRRLEEQSGIGGAGEHRVFPQHQLRRRLQIVGIFIDGGVPHVGPAPFTLDPRLHLVHVALAERGIVAGVRHHMAVDKLLIHAEEVRPLRFAVGEFAALLIDGRLVVFLHHVRVEQGQHVLVLKHHRVVLFPEFAFESFPRRQQFIPGFREGDARLFPRFVVKVENAGGDRHRDAVELAVDRGGLQLFGVKLAEIDLVFQSIEIVKAIAIFRKDRQPVPVGLHHVRLGAAGYLGGQARKMAVPAGIFRFDIDIRILLVKSLQRLEGHLMAAIAPPPGHAQVDILRQRGEGAKAQGGGEGGAYQHVFHCYAPGFTERGSVRFWRQRCDTC